MFYANYTLIKKIKSEKIWICLNISNSCSFPLLWWNTGKDFDAGKDWGQEEKRVTEDEIVGWHHWLNGHVLKQTPGDSEGQGSLAGYSSWGHKESDTTECTTVKHWTFSSVAVVTIDCLLHFSGLVAAILQHVALLLHRH